MADTIIVPPGTGVKGEVILHDNRCYEITGETPDPVTAPTITSIHTDCDTCLDNLVKTCCANPGTPVAGDDCGEGCATVPEKLYFHVTVATGVWAHLRGVVVEMFYDGNCDWSGGDSGCDVRMDLNSSNTSWTMSVSNWANNLSETLYLSATLCDPTGVYHCSPLCDVQGDVEGILKTDPGPCTP